MTQDTFVTVWVAPGGGQRGALHAMKTAFPRSTEHAAMAVCVITVRCTNRATSIAAAPPEPRSKHIPSSVHPHFSTKDHSHE